MTRTFKVIFILYLAGSAYYIFSIAGSASLGESITALNLIFGARRLAGFITGFSVRVPGTRLIQPGLSVLLRRYDAPSIGRHLPSRSS